MLLNKQQQKDAKKCEEMAEHGRGMECFGCSCSVCINQVATNYLINKKALLERLESFLESLDKEFPQHVTSKEMLELLAAEKTARRIIKIIKEF